MSDPDTHTPLIGATSQQTVVEVPAGRGNLSSSRAYKVAGITLLACVLIVGQAMIAYFLLSQRSDIKSLEAQSNDLKEQLTKGRSAGMPMKMHMPMNALQDMRDVSMEEDASTKVADKTATECQLEAIGVKPLQVPGFRPACDELGLYKAQQCYLGQCWCVNPANGQQTPGSMRQGPASCPTAVNAGSRSTMLNLPVAA